MQRYRPYWGNVSALKKKYPSLIKLLREMPRGDRFSFEMRGSFRDVCFHEREHTFSLSFGSGCDCPDQRLAASIKQKIDQNTDVFVFLGFPNAALLQQVWACIQKENKAVLIIEPSLELLAAQLEVSDLRDALRSNKVLLACGENWQVEVENAVIKNNFGAARYLNTQVGYVTEAEALQKHIEGMLRIPQAILKQNQAAYQQELKRLGWWAKNPEYRPGRRLWAHMDIRKHARFTLIQYHLVRNLLYGLRQRGWDVHFNVMRDDHYYPWYHRLVDMNRFCPDVVLLFNEGASFETALGNQVCAELPLPKVTWWTDSPVYCRHFFIRHGVPEGEFHTAADRAWVDFLSGMGAKNPAFLPGACTYRRFGRRSSELKCQISFVGQVRNHKPFLNALPKEWRDYAERVIEMKLRERFRPFEEIMDAAKPPPHNLGEDLLDEIRQKLLWEANTRFRIAAVQGLSGLDLHLYGNEQWLDFLQDEGLRAGFRGLIPYSRLPHLYRNSLVSLNIHSLQSTTCLNVRDFDVPMAGGFLVSDLLPESENLFELGFIEDLEAGNPRELICYRNTEELRRIVSFVAEHEDIRQACMAKARARIVKEHTYDYRADFLSGYIQEHL